jgi:glutamate dehydrogenase
VARDVFDTTGLWDAVRALDNVVPAAAQTRLLLEGRKLVERATRWLLRNRRSPIDIGVAVDELAPGTAELAGLLPGILSADGQQAHHAAASNLVGDCVPADLARRVASFDELFSALDIVEVATAGEREVEAVAGLYYALEDRLELRWLRDRVNDLPRPNRWQTLARLALRDDLYAQLRAITAEALAVGGADAWLERKAATVERCRQVLADIRATSTFDLATLSVGLRETHALVAG